jgi:ribose-phosphate pyrophosphokinase
MITFKAKTPSGEIIKSAISDFIFPAGEAHIKVEPKRELEATEIAVIQSSADSIHDDLFKLAMWNDYLSNLPKTPEKVLVIPYFPGARADRVSEGVQEPFGLGVYTEFINNLWLDQVIIFDPHSEKTEELLTADTVTVLEPADLFDQPGIKMMLTGTYSGVIAPDKGALARASEVAKVLDIPVYTATKTRDPNTGKLSGFSINLPPEEERYYLIVDDICDRGGTFLGLQKATGLEYGDVDLFVSHGVFSSDAIENLTGAFENVYTTNSYNPKRKLVLPGMEEDPDYISAQYSPFIRFDIIHLMLREVI